MEKTYFPISTQIGNYRNPNWRTPMETKQNGYNESKSSSTSKVLKWSRSNDPCWCCSGKWRLLCRYLQKDAVKLRNPKERTWEGGGLTEKPRSAAMERASDMPPRRLRGFFPTQLVSLPIDISKPEPWRFFQIQIEIDVWAAWTAAWSFLKSQYASSVGSNPLRIW